jgi:hypothetical protein
LPLIASVSWRCSSVQTNSRFGLSRKGRVPPRRTAGAVPAAARKCLRLSMFSSPGTGGVCSRYPHLVANVWLARRLTMVRSVVLFAVISLLDLRPRPRIGRWPISPGGFRRGAGERLLLCNNGDAARAASACIGRRGRMPPQRPPVAATASLGGHGPGSATRNSPGCNSLQRLWRLGMPSRREQTGSGKRRPPCPCSSSETVPGASGRRRRRLAGDLGPMAREFCMARTP